MGECRSPMSNIRVLVVASGHTQGTTAQVPGGGATSCWGGRPLASAPRAANVAAGAEDQRRRQLAALGATRAAIQKARRDARLGPHCTSPMIRHSLTGQGPGILPSLPYVEERSMLELLPC